MTKTQTKPKRLTTTNIRIPPEELLTYREYALSMGKSFSGLVREILSKEVHGSPATPKNGSKKTSFWDINKLSIKLGDPKASKTADKHIYNRNGK